MRRLLLIAASLIMIFSAGCIFDKTTGIDTGGNDDDVTNPPSSVSINVDASRTLVQIPEDIYGTNAVAWHGTEDGRDAKLNQLMDISGQRAIRWPGGSWGDAFIWDEMEGGGNSWVVNVDEAIRFIQSFGGTMQPIINFSGYADYKKAAYGHDVAVQKAAAWVKYMNIDHNYNVKNWEIGNEVFGGWEQGHTTGADYGVKFVDFYRAMKAVDPTINIGAVTCEDDNEIAWQGYNWWNRDAFGKMKAAGVIPDFLIIHTYPLMGKEISPETDAAMLRLPDGVARTTEKVDESVRKYFGSEYVGKIKYRMTEYRSTDKTSSMTFADAMCTAQFILEMAKNGWAGANIWDIKNGEDKTTGFDFGYISNDDKVRPTYFVFPYLTKHFGRQMVEASVSSVTPQVRVYASKDGSGNLTLFLVNNSPSKDCKAQIDVAGFTPGSTGQKYQLEPAGTTAAGNTTPIQERVSVSINGNVAPDPTSLSTISPISMDAGQTFSITIPKSTMVLLVLPPAK